MWRKLERATAAAAAAGGSSRPGSVAGGQQERFWGAVARKPAALAFFAKYYRQQARAGGLREGWGVGAVAGPSRGRTVWRRMPLRHWGCAAALLTSCVPLPPLLPTPHRTLSCC